MAAGMRKGTGTSDVKIHAFYEQSMYSFVDAVDAPGTHRDWQVFVAASPVKARIKDAGIAIRHSRGRILFYTAGSRNGFEGLTPRAYFNLTTQHLFLRQYHRQRPPRMQGSPTKAEHDCEITTETSYIESIAKCYCLNELLNMRLKQNLGFQPVHPET